MHSYHKSSPLKYLCVRVCGGGGDDVSIANLIHYILGADV